MAIDLRSVATEEQNQSLESIVNGNGDPSISYLDSLRAPSLPIVQAIVDDLQQKFGLMSEVSSKKSSTASDKCRRPSTLNKYPWFNLSHIRDYLRFRTYIDKPSDFMDTLEHFASMQDNGSVSIVKIDWSKLAHPGLFGWRMIAVDLRISETGMLVEHYMAFREMIEINEKWLHAVYETWRSVSTDDLTQDEVRELYRDAKFSEHAYRELLFDGILRGQTSKILSNQRTRANQAIINALILEVNGP